MGKIITTEEKRVREQMVVAEMIALYCKKNHGGAKLCPKCQGLLDYAVKRSGACPLMEQKTFCSNCKIHCYKPEMREAIRRVMRFSGPRMLFHHPMIAVGHLVETKREQKRLRRQACSPEKKA